MIPQDEPNRSKRKTAAPTAQRFSSTYEYLDRPVKIALPTQTVQERS